MGVGVTDQRRVQLFERERVVEDRRINDRTYDGQFMASHAGIGHHEAPSRGIPLVTHSSVPSVAQAAPSMAKAGNQPRIDRDVRRSSATAQIAA